MVHLAIVRAQNRPGRAGLGGHGQGRRPRLDHAQRVGTIRRFESGAFVATGTRALVAEIPARAVVAGRTLRTVILSPVVLAPVALRPILPGALIGLPVVVAGAFVAANLDPVLPLAGRLRTSGRISFAVGCGAFVLEVDVIARDELIAPDDLGQRPLGLHGAHQPKIVLGVLQMVFGQHPVAGGVGVAGELLVFLIDVLGRAADLDPSGPLESKARLVLCWGLPPPLLPPLLRLRPR